MMGLVTLVAMVALALQTTIPHLLPLAMLMPNLVLILAVNLGMRHHTMSAALTAFAIGYATDAFAGSQLGLNELLFTLVFALTYWISRSLFSAGSGVGAIAVFGGVIFCDFGNYFVSSGWMPPAHLAVLMPSIIVQSVVTTLCAFPVFAMMGQVGRLIGLRQRGSRE